MAAREIWKLVQDRAISKVLLVRFLGGVFGGVSVTAVYPVAFYWAHVQPLNDNVVSFVAAIVAVAALECATKRGWQLDYFKFIVGSTAIPSGLDYVIFTVLLGELAEPGDEQRLLGSLVTAVAFVAGSLGLVLTKHIGAQFDVTNQDLMVDLIHVRVHATLLFCVAYSCQVVSLGWLLLLPQHASEAREWKKRGSGGTSRMYGTGLMSLLLSSFGYAVAVHTLSVNASIACGKSVGGADCY